MTPLQGEPPRIDFKLPKKLKAFLRALRQFCIEIQPLKGRGLLLDQTVKGRRLKLGEDDATPATGNTATHRLQLLNASESGVPKVRVRLGYVAGQIADAGMTDPDDDPAFKLTLPSSAGFKYIYCDVTVKYNTTTGIWERDTATANAVNYSATAPGSRTNTATKIYVYLGAVEVVSATGGYTVRVITPAPVSNDQCVSRTGNATTYVDANRST